MDKENKIGLIALLTTLLITCVTFVAVVLIFSFAPTTPEDDCRRACARTAVQQVSADACVCAALP